MDKNPREKPEKTSDQAFDLWLKRGLHQLFDDVANEPIPEELLRLIEEDRGE
ncbi:NepR family anti-sigma factor [Acetobacter persici]|uniref:NepR family anti-sigma factor n=1 Tax=Acetobacter persici TaxID=1076596 RepID=UPI0036DC0A10